MRFPALLVSALLALAGVLAACGEDEHGGAAAGDRALRIVATTTHAADIARAVGGDRVDVRSILQPGADAHDYEVRPDDVRAVADADLVVRSGGDVDDWLAEVVRNAGGDAPVLDLIRTVRTRRSAGGKVDPHWWQDPRNVARAARAIGAALAGADPGGAQAYARAAHRYVRRVRELDAAAAACFARVPDARRKLVTTHDAYGYYAARYDMEVVGTVIPSLSTQGQPSAGETAKLVATIEREGVRTIFAESAVDSRVERAIAREAGARVGPGLWADSLGRPGSPGATWLGAFAADTKALVAGFTDGEKTCALPA